MREKQMRGIFWICLFLTPLFLFADDSETATLEKKLQSEQSDSSRINILIDLSYAYLDSKPELAIKYAKQGLDLAIKNELISAEAASLNTIGIIFWSSGDYPRALESLLEALKINETLGNDEGRVKNMINIGLIYSEHEDEHLSLEYSFKAKELAEKIQYKRGIATSELNIGDSYEKLNRLDSSRMFTQMAYESAERFNFNDLKGVTLNNLGNIHSKMKQNSLAMEYYRLSLPFLISEGQNEAIANVYLGQAKLFMHAAVEDSALYYGRLAYVTGCKDNLLKQILDASLFLAPIYLNNKMPDSAYYFKSIAMDAKDSLFSQANIKNVQNSSFKEKIRQQQIEEQKALEEHERQNNLQMLFIFAFIIFFFFVVMMLSRRKIKPSLIEFLGVLALLMAFEFLSLLIHPFIEIITFHSPILVLLCLVVVASLLVPLHHKAEKWVKKKLSHEPHPPKKVEE